MTATPPDTTQAPVLYCANHPNTETTLRCNRCEKPICAKCAVLTPTGYRCKECVRGQQKVFDTAEARDYLLAVPVAGILGFLGGLIIPRLFFYFVLFGAPAAGALYAEIIRRIVQKRRSKRLFQFATAAVFIGGMLPACATLLPATLLWLGGEQAGGFLAGAGFGLLWQAVYAFIAASTVYYRLSGIRL